MNQARERLLARAAAATLDLDDVVLDRLLVYYELLRKWNRRLNLTGLTIDDETDESMDRLLVEPVLARRHVGLVETTIDVGSGGGSPAIPFAIGLTPSPKMTLIESRSKKCTFLREALREVGLEGRVVEGRFEEFADRSEEATAYSTLTIRAVRTDQALWESANRVLRSGGTVAWFHGEAQELPAAAPFQWSPPVLLVQALRSFLSLGTKG